MDPLEITYRLKKLGKTQTQVAREVGVSVGVVSNVIHNKTTAHAIAQHIANLLEMEIGAIWPDRYVFRPRNTSLKRRALDEKTTSMEATP